MKQQKPTGWKLYGLDRPYRTLAFSIYQHYQEHSYQRQHFIVDQFNTRLQQDKLTKLKKQTNRWGIKRRNRTDNEDVIKTSKTS
jgi:hypothetical protein